RFLRSSFACWCVRFFSLVFVCLPVCLFVLCVCERVFCPRSSPTKKTTKNPKNKNKKQNSRSLLFLLVLLVVFCVLFLGGGWERVSFCVGVFCFVLLFFFSSFFCFVLFC